ncbi:type II toxin-antitoxin system RatA family toxin [Streptomyces fumanus]|uniref:Cyclase n=1 Tax=Streptomyces fumanus TaxID=67302 RepID=A0A919EA21_9ACTN|nr:aromatase/cyclase [Streptomyces fumanus]GHF29088.1 cyclase [Streptomyces fumanus]
MPHVVLQARTDALDPAEAYRRISDFRRYPEFTDTVREVTVEPPLADGSAISEWAVVFRGGLMRWRERDTFDPDTRTIAFEQLSGDFKTFTGSWRCAPRDGGTLVVFEATFDLGIPSLAEILDPVAEATLRTLIGQIVTGLLDAEVVTDGRAAAARD